MAPRKAGRGEKKSYLVGSKRSGPMEWPPNLNNYTSMQTRSGQERTVKSAAGRGLGSLSKVGDAHAMASSVKFRPGTDETLFVGTLVGPVWVVFFAEAFRDFLWT